MMWTVLIASGLAEPVWALALALHGRPLFARAALFVVGAGISMGGLGWALTQIPVAVGYAAWVGIGAVATIVLSVARGQEAMTWLRGFFILLLVGGVVGLRVLA